MRLHVKLPSLLLAVLLCGCGLKPAPTPPASHAFCQSIPTVVYYPKDLEAARNFYIQKLDFKEDYSFNKGFAYGCKLSNGGVEIVLVHVLGGGKSAIEKFQINVRVAEIDSLYALLCERGVTIVKKPEPTDWGTRWFQIQATDGLVIAFEELAPHEGQEK